MFWKKVLKKIKISAFVAQNLWTKLWGVVAVLIKLIYLTPR